MSDPAATDLPGAIALARQAVNEATALGSGVGDETRRNLATARRSHPDNLDLLFLAFQFHFRAGELDEAERLARRRLELAPPRSQHTARALCNLGLIAHRQSRFDDAEALLTGALRVDREIGHLEGVARDLGNLALVPESLGELDRAESLYLESLAIARSLPGPEAEDIAAGKIANLGDIARARGRLREAAALWREAQEMFHRLNITKWDADFSSRFSGLSASDAPTSDPPANG